MKRYLLITVMLIGYALGSGCCSCQPQEQAEEKTPTKEIQIKQERTIQEGPVVE